jgi:hypothetical protein
MKKGKAPDSGEMRTEYKRCDFPGRFVRGKPLLFLRQICDRKNEKEGDQIDSTELGGSAVVPLILTGFGKSDTKSRDCNY